MARPRKNNADYFSHDNNMRNHRKIKAIRNKFGLEGYAVFNMFLETLTECDQFKIKLKRDIDWELLSADFGILSSLLKEIIQYCIEIEIIIKDGDYFLSSNLIERLTPLTEKRERFREKYSKTDVSDAETIVSDAEMPQSKVNKSKVNKTKEEESENNNFPPALPSLKSLPGIETGDSYVADGWSPKDRLAMKKRLEKALGLKKTNKWQDFIFGTARDFLTAFEKYQGYAYPDNVLLDEVSKTLAKWYELGETRETVREMLIAFFEGKKSDAVTVTPNSVFSSHTYNSWKQNKL